MADSWSARKSRGDVPEHLKPYIYRGHSGMDESRLLPPCSCDGDALAVSGKNETQGTMVCSNCNKLAAQALPLPMAITEFVALTGRLIALKNNQVGENKK